VNTPIPTFTGRLAGHAQPLVDARDLHAHLEVGRDFANWIKRRIEQYGFVEGEDFSPILAKTSKGIFGGRPRTEYHLSLEMAKELALVENNPQGRQIRRALIALEQQVRERLPALEAENAALRRLCITANTEMSQLVRYHAMGLTTTEIGRLVGRSRHAVRRRLQHLNQAGVLAYRPVPRPGRAAIERQAARQLSLLAGGEA